MKKIIILFLLVISLGGYLYYHYHSKKPFYCDAHIITHIYFEENKVELNLYANTIVSMDSEGTVSLSGSVRQDDKEYLVSRTIFFTIQQLELDDIYKTVITHEEKSKVDEVPDSLWQKYILPRPTGIIFNSKFKQLNKNAIFFQELSNPLFVCTKIE